MYKFGVLYHLLLSAALYFIGAFSTLTLFQFLFLLTLTKKKEVQFYLYLPMLFFILIKIFASAYYLLYFLALGASVCYTLHYKFLYPLKKLLLYSLYLGLLYTLFVNFEYLLYEIYIELNFNDSVYFISNEVMGMLMYEHLFILLILGYNKGKLFRNNICI